MSRLSILVLGGLILSIAGLFSVFHTDLAPIDQPLGQYIASISFLVLTACAYVAFYHLDVRTPGRQKTYWQDHVFVILFYVVGFAVFMTLLLFFGFMIWVLVLILIVEPMAGIVVSLQRKYLNVVRRFYVPPR